MDLDTKLHQYASEYDHSRYFGMAGLSCPFPPRKQSFLAELQSAKTYSDAAKEQSIGSNRPLFPPSNMEKLPHEILRTIFEYLDLASIFALSCANSNTRQVVRSMPEIAKISEEPFAANAVAMMIRAGTARYFTPGDFMRAFETSSCDLCKGSSSLETDAFTTDICLLRCCRVCRICMIQNRKISFLPLEMAEECFDLDVRKYLPLEGVARAHVWAKVESLGREPMFPYSTAEVISTHAVMNLAITKHGGSSNDLQAIETLVQKYISSKNIRVGRCHPIRLAEGLTISGFREAVEAAWIDKGLCYHNAKRSLITSLPYSHPKTFPPRIEPGFSCDGCTRDGKYYRLDKPYLPKAYLQHQLYKHVMGCQMAQDILAGVYLPLAREKELFEEVLLHLREIFEWQTDAPRALRHLIFHRPLDLKADAFMTWYWKALRLITEAGEAALKRKKTVPALKRKVSEPNDSGLGPNRGKALILANPGLPVHSPTFNSTVGYVDDTRHSYGTEHDKAYSPAKRLKAVSVHNEDEGDGRQSGQNPTKAAAETSQHELTETETKLLGWAREEGLVNSVPDDETVDSSPGISTGPPTMDGSMGNI